MTQRRCAFDDDTKLTTIWDERYCTDAAFTNSTTKQAEVVRAAMGEGLLRLHPWPWNEERAWESIGQVRVAGIRGVDAAFLAERDRFVIDEMLARGIPLVINLAGGYQSNGTSVALHVQTARVAVHAPRAFPGSRPRQERFLPQGWHGEDTYRLGRGGGGRSGRVSGRSRG